MKFTISIPGALFLEAKKLARRLKKSRSQLYGEAMAEYLRRHDPEAVTQALNRVCADVGACIDPFVGMAATHALRASEW